MLDLNTRTGGEKIEEKKSKLPVVWIATSLLLIPFLLVLVSPSLATLSFGVIFTMILVPVLTWNILQ